MVRTGLWLSLPVLPSFSLWLLSAVLLGQTLLSLSISISILHGCLYSNYPALPSPCLLLLPRSPPGGTNAAQLPRDTNTHRQKNVASLCGPATCQCVATEALHPQPHPPGPLAILNTLNTMSGFAALRSIQQPVVIS